MGNGIPKQEFVTNIECGVPGEKVGRYPTYQLVRDDVAHMSHLSSNLKNALAWVHEGTRRLKNDPSSAVSVDSLRREVERWDKEVKDLYCAIKQQSRDVSQIYRGAVASHKNTLEENFHITLQAYKRHDHYEEFFDELAFKDTVAHLEKYFNKASEQREELGPAVESMMRAHPPDCTDVQHFKSTLELRTADQAVDTSAEVGETPKADGISIDSVWERKPRILEAATSLNKFFGDVCDGWMSTNEHGWHGQVNDVKRKAQALQALVEEDWGADTFAAVTSAALKGNGSLQKAVDAVIEAMVTGGEAKGDAAQQVQSAIMQDPELSNFKTLANQKLSPAALAGMDLDSLKLGVKEAPAVKQE